MTVTTGGAITVDARDFTFTHRSKTLAIKVRSDFEVVVGCVKTATGWEGVRELWMFNQGSIGTVDAEMQKAGGAVAWVKNVLVAEINRWLAELFPPVAAPTPSPAPAPAGDAWSQLDAAIFGLRAYPQPDGTIKVVA